jgi:hypothetical protein
MVAYNQPSKAFSFTVRLNEVIFLSRVGVDHVMIRHNPIIQWMYLGETGGDHLIKDVTLRLGQCKVEESQESCFTRSRNGDCAFSNLGLKQGFWSYPSTWHTPFVSLYKNYHGHTGSRLKQFFISGLRSYHTLSQPHCLRGLECRLLSCHLSRHSV